MKSPKFQIFKDGAGEFRFRLLAGNNEVVLASEGYKNKAGCQNGIESVKKNSGDDARFVTKSSTNDETYFELTAANSQVIGTSQMYKSESGRSNGIKSVQKIAAGAPVEDTTG